MNLFSNNSIKLLRRNKLLMQTSILLWKYRKISRYANWEFQLQVLFKVMNSEKEVYVI